MTTLFVVTAGLSTPSTTRQVADAIAAAVVDAAAHRAAPAEVQVRTVELRTLATDLAHATTSGTWSQRLTEVSRQLAAADGLIAVTPVFKASYSGLFKMFFDVLDVDALVGMPTIVAATAGSTRHTLVTEHALRPLLTFMHAVVVPTSLFAATADFGGPAGADFSRRVERAAGELADLMLASPRPSRFSGAAPADGGEGYVPMPHLLRGQTER
ncbi:CE1759 family FMN reductase [Corynebacterium timonense]|uniref:FMN reductase n=1 Tax=Corynebacterium timonense TaxID=441500 RepID=A0A1H1NMU0_9CORY|nr:CE1759 family FMN reductase [Corynebacterium timonense]SDS00170.1 FMN reductase [Corynebacterium timonense]